MAPKKDFPHFPKERQLLFSNSIPILSSSLVSMVSGEKKKKLIHVFEFFVHIFSDLLSRI